MASDSAECCEISRPLFHDGNWSHRDVEVATIGFRAKEKKAVQRHQAVPDSDNALARLACQLGRNMI
jgi:hypothetical protein